VRKKIVKTIELLDKKSKNFKNSEVKKKWDVKFVKLLTRILQDLIHGKSKFVDFVVEFVIILLGMETICRSIGGLENDWHE
jgi:hypothetical protein